MDQKQKKLKLEYDLGCWKNFFVVCHDYERSFLPDDQFRICHDAENAHYPGDVTERDLNWSVDDLFDEFYLNDIQHLYGDKEYQKHLQPQKEGKDQEKHHFAHVLLFILSIICFALVIFCLCTIPIFCLQEMTSHIYSHTTLLAIGLIGLVSCTILNRQFIRKTVAIDKDSFNHEESFSQWFHRTYDEDPNWNQTLAKAKKNFHEQVERIVSSKERQDELNQLIDIKKQLRQQLPLPKEFQNESAVNQLFAIILMGKANDLNEAVSVLSENKEAADQDIISQFDSDLALIRKGFLNLSEEEKDRLDPEFRQAVTPNDILIHQILALHFQSYQIKSEDLLR